MGNECDNWFQITCNDITTIQKIYSELMHMRNLSDEDDKTYGFRDITITDTTLTARGLTKRNPPIEEFKKWLAYPSVHLTALYKDEFLQFAGRIIDDVQEHVDFETVTSDDVRNATSGILYALHEKLHLADHMDDEWRNDN